MKDQFKYYTLFLISLYILHFAQCTKCACKKKTNEKNNFMKIDKVQNTAENDECQLYEPSRIDNHLPMQNCYYGVKKKGKVINSYKTYENHTQDIFKSACMKCTICLAVAQSMNEALQAYYNENFRSKCPLLGENCFCKVLQPVCTSGFKNYDLREVNGDVLLTAASIKSKHVSSTFHGSWTEKLREICNNYLNNMECDLDEKLKSGNLNFVEYLCNGDGIFRDCRNMKLPLLENSDQQSNLCVKCN